MKTAIECLYKGVREVKAGSFVNSDGVKVSYNGSYKILFDQIINGIPKETELKISKDIALNITPNCKPYDKIVINLDITIYGNNNISVKVVSIEKK